MLGEALSKANWGASSSLLAEIAAHTYRYDEYPQIMKAVWDGLNHANKNWRQVYKALVLLDSLIKNGAEKVIEESRDHIYTVKTLIDFTCMEDGQDRGAGIRDKSKAVVELLQNNEMIRDEREKAKVIREKIGSTIQSSYGATTSGSGSMGSGGYGGRGSVSGSSGKYGASGSGDSKFAPYKDKSNNDDDDEDDDKPKKEKKKKKKSKKDDDDEEEEEEKPKKSSKPKAVELSGSEDDEPKKEEKPKKSKKKGKKDAEEDAFKSASASAAPAKGGLDADIFAADWGAATTSAPAAATHDDFGFGGFTSAPAAAPVRQQAPAPVSSGFDLFGGSIAAAPAPVSNNRAPALDPFGDFGSAPAATSSYNSVMQPMGGSSGYGGAKPSVGGGGGLSNLISLDSLSLNSEKKPTPVVPTANMSMSSGMPTGMPVPTGMMPAKPAYPQGMGGGGYGPGPQFNSMPGGFGGPPPPSYGGAYGAPGGYGAAPGGFGGGFGPGGFSGGYGAPPARGPQPGFGGPQPGFGGPQPGYGGGFAPPRGPPGPSW